MDCGSRWERVEWEPDVKVNTSKSGSSTDRREMTMVAYSKTPYPERLPPPKSRPDLSSLLVSEYTPSSMTPSRSMPQTPTPSDVPHRTQGPLPAVEDGNMTEIPVTPSWLRTPSPSPAAVPSDKRSLGAGVRPMQARAKPRTPRRYDGELILDADEMDAAERAVVSP